MLALQRDWGERIIIGGNIIVQLVRPQDGGAVLGITAPRDVTVNREEVERRSRPTDLPARLGRKKI
jgi:carbon storage regulator CsrA